MSPFTPPSKRSKYRGYNSRQVRTLDSNIVLNTPRSEDDIADADGYDLEFGMELGKLKAAIGGDDGEPILDDSLTTYSEKSHAHSRTGSGRAPPTYRVMEMGFNLKTPRSPNSSDDIGVRGIRVDVEKATSTM